MLTGQMLGPHQICLWALVDETHPLVTRSFSVYGTGQELSSSPGKYIATVQEGNGILIWHIFEQEKLT